MEEHPKSKNNSKLVGLVIAVVIAVVLIATSIAIVPSGSTGVVVNLGAVSENVLSEGLKFKIPFVTNIVLIDNRTQIAEITGTAASKDLQTVSNKIAVNYRVDNASSATLYKNVGISYETRIILPSIQESVKSATAKFTAEELITKRSEVSQVMKDELSAKVNPYGITIENLNIINFEFSQEFNAAIEAKQTAQQLALKAEQDLSRIAIEAKQKVVEAEAEAKALQLKSEALSENILLLEYIQKWDGKLPIVTGSEGNILDLSTVLGSNSNTSQINNNSSITNKQTTTEPTTETTTKETKTE